MKRPYVFEIYREHGGWNWRLRAGNRRIVAEGGEPYTAEHHAVCAVERLVAELGGFGYRIERPGAA